MRTQAPLEFLPADKVGQPIEYPKREDARYVCEMCGRDASALCEPCLKDLVETMVESVLERMIDQGKLDAVLVRVLDRRAARGGVDQAVDHSLIDEVSGEIRDSI